MLTLAAELQNLTHIFPNDETGHLLKHNQHAIWHLLTRPKSAGSNNLPWIGCARELCVDIAGAVEHAYVLSSLQLCNAYGLHGQNYFNRDLQILDLETFESLASTPKLSNSL